MSRDAARELEVLVRAGWRLVALETFEEDRAQKALERAARAVDRPLRSWSVASGLSPDGAGAGSLDAGLRAIEACEEPALFALLDAQRELGDTRAVRRLRDLLPRSARRGQTLLLVGPVLDLPLELVREAGRVELPLPRAAELEPLFRKLAGEGADAPALGACVRAALGLTAAEAVRVFRKALQLTGGASDEAAAWMVREKREALRRTPALSFHEAGTALAQVGGLGELKRWLGERRRAFSDEARAFGLPAPRGLLLLGVQGCGKSLSAKAVAREWNFPLLRLDLAAAFGGGPERSPELAVREAMSVAESLAPAVLWIDEIEKAFASPGTDARGNRVFGSFITWLSEKDAPVFVVATANDVAQLPPELLRRGRFDEIFFVDLPTHAERLEILAIHLSKRGRDPAQFGLEALASASERLSGAELEQAVAAALYTAFAAGRELEDNDLANAVAETVPLYETYEERIKELRNWARTRARPASVDPKMVDLFRAR
jgi:SpoVK/Ycf46/Vps4 family AAA+-type ATPase